MKPARMMLAAALLLVAAALAVQIVRAKHAAALWRDECGALAIAQMPGLGAMYRYFPHEAFPLAFPLTLRGWITVAGDSDASLRMFGVFVTVLLLVALWVHARVAGTYPVASVALFAVAPIALIVPSIRGYGLAAAAIVLAMAAHARLVERVDRARLIAAFAASLFAAHTAMHDAALLLAIGVSAAIVVARRQGLRNAAAILACDAIVALSLLIYIPPLSIAQRWAHLPAVELSWQPILSGLAQAIGNKVMLLVVPVAAIAAVASALFAMREDESPERDRRLFHLICLPLMLVTYYAWLQVLDYIPRPWYFLPLIAAAAACFDGLLASTRGQRHIFVLVCAVYIASWQMPAALRFGKMRATNIDVAAAEVARFARPNDLVLVSPWFFGVSYSRYHRAQAPWITVPDLEDRRIHRYDLVKEHMTRPDEAMRPVIERVQATLQRGGTVWLIGYFERPPRGAKPEPLPPAPHPFTGWDDSTYLVGWSYQLGDFLATRSALVREQQPAKGFTSPLEQVSLCQFRGWRQEATGIDSATAAGSRRIGSGPP